MPGRAFGGTFLVLAVAFAGCASGTSASDPAVPDDVAVQTDPGPSEVGPEALDVAEAAAVAEAVESIEAAQPASDVTGLELVESDAANPQYPEACNGMMVPSADKCPAGMPADNETVHCCDDDNRLLYCKDGALYCHDCKVGEVPGYPPACGWSHWDNYYGCGWEGADPSGVHPQSCRL